MIRTPVLGKLPKVLVRNPRPEPTPMIGGRIVRPVAELVKGPITEGDIKAAVEMASLAGETDPAWRHAYQELLRTSCAFFAAEMIRGPRKAPYHGKFLLGRHHLEWDELIHDHRRINILAARDHGKSHFWSLAYPLWKGGYSSPGCEIYIFSNTQPQAEKFLAIVKDELLMNPKLGHLVPWGAAKNPKGPAKWSSREITLRNETVIRARGYGVSVRGGHPDAAVCDDVLNDDDIYSETIRRRNIEYFLSAIANMVPTDGQLVVVGTPMHQADLYSALADTGIYECRTYPAISKTGTLLFPERYNKGALADKRKELRSEARFAREFMCQPLTDEASLFPSKLFEGSDVRLPYILGLSGRHWHSKGCLLYTGVDIALSSEVGADYTVIFTVAVDGAGNRWVANIRRGKGWAFQHQLDEIKEEYYLMRSEVIHIESNQAQRVFGDEIVRTTDLPVRRFFTTGVGGRQPGNPWKKGATSIAINKHHIDRGVPGLRLSLENKKWRIPRGDERSIDLTDTWIGEMNAMGWIDGRVQSVGEHDDMVMACWMANAAVELGNVKLDWIDAKPDLQKPVLAAPIPQQSLDLAADVLEQERKALAAVQEGRPAECDRAAYLARVRGSLREYAEHAMDYGDEKRAITALESIKRLDARHQLRSYDTVVARNDGAEYIPTPDDSGDQWKPREGALTPEDLGII